MDKSLIMAKIIQGGGILPKNNKSICEMLSTIEFIDNNYVSKNNTDVHGTMCLFFWTFYARYNEYQRESFIDVFENSPEHELIFFSFVHKHRQYLDVQNLDFKNEGNTLLMFVARLGACKLVKILLKHDINIDLQNNDGYTALMLASENGHTDVVKHLIESDADFDIDLQNNDGYTTLMLAAKNGHTDVVKHLIKNNADIDFQNKEGSTSLMLASKNGHIDVVKHLIQNRAYIDLETKEDYTALMLASENGHIDVVKHLIQSDADTDSQNNDGYTALMLAIQNQHTDVAKYLIKKNANIYLKNNDGYTALMLATQHQHIDVLKSLIIRGANIDLQNAEGYTALMLAIQHQHVDVVKYLIQSGADIRRQSRYTGNSAFSIAFNTGNIEIVNILLSAHRTDSNIQSHDVPTSVESLCDKYKSNGYTTTTSVCEETQQYEANSEVEQGEKQDYYTSDTYDLGNTVVDSANLEYIPDAFIDSDTGVMFMLKRAEEVTLDNTKAPKVEKSDEVNSNTQTRRHQRRKSNIDNKHPINNNTTSKDNNVSMEEEKEEDPSKFGDVDNIASKANKTKDNSSKKNGGADTDDVIKNIESVLNNLMEYYLRPLYALIYCNILHLCEEDHDKLPKKLFYKDHVKLPSAAQNIIIIALVCMSLHNIYQAELIFSRLAIVLGDVLVDTISFIVFITPTPIRFILFIPLCLLLAVLVILKILSPLFLPLLVISYYVFCLILYLVGAIAVFNLYTNYKICTAITEYNCKCHYHLQSIKTDSKGKNKKNKHNKNKMKMEQEQRQQQQQQQQQQTQPAFPVNI